jgi:cell division septation protein DedD
MARLWASALGFALGVFPVKPLASAMQAVQELRMTESLPSVSKLASLSEGEAAVRTSKALYRAALGPVNAGHYLALFERFDANGRAGLVWNSAAGFFTPVWLVFRRLWALAAGYAALVVLLMLLGRAMGPLLASWPTGVVVGLKGSLLLLLVVVPGMTGNAMLHAHTRQRVERARAGAPSLGDACIALAEDAPSWNSLKAVLVGGAVAAAGLIAAAVLSTRSEAPPVDGSSTGARATQDIQAPAAPVPVAPRVAKVEEATPATPVASAPEITEAVALPVPTERPPAPVEAVPEPKVMEKPAAAPAPQPEKSPPVQAPKAREPAPAAKARPASQPAVPGPKPQTPTANTAASSYAINVGVFGDPANVARVMAQLKAAKLPAYSQAFEGAKGPLTRVRVGPFANSDQAAAAAQRIRSLGLDAVVFKP